MKFIYESPDGGKTVYRRPLYSNELKKELIDSEEKTINIVETIFTEDGKTITIADIT